MTVINTGPNIDLCRAALGFLCNPEFLFGKQPVHRALTACKALFGIFKCYCIGCRSDARHRVSRLFRQHLYTQDIDSVRTCRLQSLLKILRAIRRSDFHVHIFAHAAQSDTQWRSKAHDLMRIKSMCIHNIQSGSADRLLEKAQHIQMSGKAQRTIFRKFYTYHHTASPPLCSKQIPPPKRAAPQP